MAALGAVVSYFVSLRFGCVYCSILRVHEYTLTLRYGFVAYRTVSQRNKVQFLVVLGHPQYEPMGYDPTNKERQQRRYSEATAAAENHMVAAN